MKLFVVYSPNLNSIFSNTQHFAVYVRCMPSRRLRRLDAPLVVVNVESIYKLMSTSVMSLSNHCEYDSAVCVWL